jgi:hypothetical protein
MRKIFRKKKVAARQPLDQQQDVKCIPLNEVDYEVLFFKESEVKTRNGKVVYIRKEFHDRILKIVRVIGENELSLFSYLDNVLEHHFTMFQDDITRLYREKNTDIF